MSSSLGRALTTFQRRGVRRSIETYWSVLDDLAFDALNRTDTFARVERSELSVESANEAVGKPYQLTRGRALRALFNWLSPPTTGAFLDLGSGKGRALLAAASYGFKRVIGVEYSPQLNAIALQNIARYRKKLPADVVLESHCLDAAEYAFRNDETLVYLFNPFGPPVLEKVIANLARSLHERPRSVQLAYTMPEFEDVLRSTIPIRNVAKYSYGGFDFLVLTVAV